MSKVLEEVLTKVDKSTLFFFIKTWSEYSPLLQSSKEIAESVQNEFSIECTVEDVINAFAVDMEIEDTKLQFKHLNLY
jgi:phage terminase small subunit